MPRSRNQVRLWPNYLRFSAKHNFGQTSSHNLHYVQSNCMYRDWATVTMPALNEHSCRASSPRGENVNVLNKHYLFTAFYDLLNDVEVHKHRLVRVSEVTDPPVTVHARDHLRWEAWVEDISSEGITMQPKGFMHVDAVAPCNATCTSHPALQKIKGRFSPYIFHLLIPHHSHSPYQYVQRDTLSPYMWL